MRVVGGMFRGRRLLVPPAKTTRPTVERVREALFNMLGSHVQGQKIVDLYAGSGALGIEALSRGASVAAFVDSGRVAIGVIRKNLEMLNLGPHQTVQVVARPVERAAAQLLPLGPFDIAFVDPPFAAVRDGTSQQALAGIVRQGLFHTDSLIVLEYPSDQLTPEIPGLFVDDVRPYGDTHLCFFRVESSTASTGETT